MSSEPHWPIQTQASGQDPEEPGVGPRFDRLGHPPPGGCSWIVVVPMIFSLFESRSNIVFWSWRPWPKVFRSTTAFSGSQSKSHLAIPTQQDLHISRKPRQPEKNLKQLEVIFWQHYCSRSSYGTCPTSYSKKPHTYKFCKDGRCDLPEEIGCRDPGDPCSKGQEDSGIHFGQMWVGYFSMSAKIPVLQLHLKFHSPLQTAIEDIDNAASTVKSWKTRRTLNFQTIDTTEVCVFSFKN